MNILESLDELVEAQKAAKTKVEFADMLVASVRLPAIRDRVREIESLLESFIVIPGNPTEGLKKALALLREEK